MNRRLSNLREDRRRWAGQTVICSPRPPGGMHEIMIVVRRIQAMAAPFRARWASHRNDSPVRLQTKRITMLKWIDEAAANPT